MAGSVVDSNFSSQAGGAIAIDMLSVNQFGSNYKGFADLISIINNIADSAILLFRDLVVELQIIILISMKKYGLIISYGATKQQPE